VSALSDKDWAFDSLLGGAPVTTIRICRLYEYAREVTAWTENSISLGQLTTLLVHPELLSPLFGFCITKPGCSGDWLRVPFFRLSGAIRDQLYKLYDSHCSALVDPSQPLHDMPFLPVQPGPPFDTSNQEVKLHIPLVGGDQFRRECFDAFLAQRFPQAEQHTSAEGGKAEIRQLKNDLRYLGALRLLRCMTTREAIQHTARTLGQPLYAHPSRWSSAKSEAIKIIESFEDELRPIKELFAQAPNDITWTSYDPTKGKLEYG
jgi:hypothetical protein